MDRCTSSGNFFAFLAPGLSSRACPEPDFICKHQPRLEAAGFAFFLNLADLPTQPWYYVPLMAFSVVCFDTIFLTAWRWARPAAMILVMFTVPTAFLFELPLVYPSD